MNILYVYAHPNPTSFNSMLKQQALDVFAEGKIPIKLSDLYAEHFKSVADWQDFDLNLTEMNPQYFLAQQEAYNKQKLAIDIVLEINKITWADHIIFQFPLWWFSTPAILKGWFDRVLAKGFAYDAGKVFNDGLLKEKTASLVVSTQSPESAYQMNGLHQATIDMFLHHIHHTLRFAGINTISPFVTYAAFNLDTARQESIKNDYRAYLEAIIH